MAEASNLCLSCGLCCDGSLIGFVQLEPEEIPAIKKVMEIEEEEGQGFFLQPCTKFCKTCTIYADRPQSCDAFNCGLLQSLQGEELSFELALKVVDEVKVKKHLIEQKVQVLPFKLQSTSFYFQIVELKRLLSQEKNVTFKELKNDIDELDNILLDKFGL